MRRPPSRPAAAMFPTRPRRPRLGLLAPLLALALWVTPAVAHLSIIRQGPESQGGIEAGDRFGGALVAGDFNGDTYDDIAMGAPLEDLGALSNAGAVIVNYGSRYGITHVGSQLLTATLIGHANQSDARFGSAVAAGDFDLDGYDDLVVGAPYEDVNGVGNAGRFYVVYGSANGLQGNALVVDQTSGGGSIEANDRFGSSFAVGNFNGDGGPYPDLAIGAPGEDNGAGAVFINYFGGPLGLTSGLATWLKQSSLGGADVAGDEFGFALAAGNLVGTTPDDLAIGAPFRTPAGGTGGNPGAGTLYVVRGSASGITASSPLSYTAASIGSIQAGGYFGYALAIGRLFEGPYRSLAIGEPGRTVGGLVKAGRVLVVEGGTTLDWPNARILLQSSGGAGVVHANDLFGSALATGDYYNPDGTDDLGIGSPGDGFGSWPNAGQFQIFPGGPSGPTGAGWSAFNQGTLNEPFEPDDEFGAAIAFGRFDEGSRGGFAVGAPGERYENPAEGAATYADAGQIHMVLPWRQTFGMACLRSVVFDCENSMVFSQKPFERVRIASTTKAMTLLVAAERSQLPASHPDHVDLDVFYLTPDWVADEITGSQFNLVAGEFMTIRNLLYACLYRSGNDAAYAIADACGSGATTDARIADFVGAMNAKAAALGMTRSHFNNPPGFQQEAYGPELGEHYSTAYDMALLSRAVLQNPLARQVSENLSRDVVRTIFYWGDYVTFPWTIMNFFPGMNLPNATGIKGGFTDAAQTTGLFSVKRPGDPDDVIATTFTTIEDSPQYTTDAQALINLGAAECSNAYVIGPAVRPPFRIVKAHLATATGSRWGASASVPDQVPGDLHLEVFRQSGAGEASASIGLLRTSEAEFGSDVSITLGVDTFHEHHGIRVTNMGDDYAMVRTRSSLEESSVDWKIAPGEAVLLPAESRIGSPPEGYQMTIWPLGPPVHLTFEEHYGFRLSALPGAQAPPVFGTRLLRDTNLSNEGLSLFYSGGDAQTAGELTLAVREGSIAVGVGDPPRRAADALTLEILGASPNPFSSRMQVAFRLARAARVEGAIFDIQGRPVREFDARQLPAGLHRFDWDGRRADGTPVAMGVYFVRFRADGGSAANARIVLAR